MRERSFRLRSQFSSCHVCSIRNNRPNYFSKRADRGNAISKENPSFVVGAAGGCGQASCGWPEPVVSDPVLRPCSRASFVSVPIANFVTAGGSQVQRGPRMVLLELIGRIIRPGTIKSSSLLWVPVQHGKIITEVRTSIMGKKSIHPHAQGGGLHWLPSMIAFIILGGLGGRISSIAFNRVLGPARGRLERIRYGTETDYGP